MPSRAFRRRFAATLLVATLAVLACAAPSHAAGLRLHRSFDEVTLDDPLHLFVSLLFQLFEKGGGGMDPNGLH